MDFSSTSFDFKTILTEAMLFNKFHIVVKKSKFKV